jgi:hypothetical protein
MPGVSSLCADAVSMTKSFQRSYHRSLRARSDVEARSNRVKLLSTLELSNDYSL